MLQTMRKLGIYALVASLCTASAACSEDDELNGDPDDAGLSDTDTADTGQPDADAPPPECPLSFEDTGQARVFTFGSKIGVEDAETYDSYESYFRGQVREIADCMSEERPNLLLFPEDAGLHAGLIGSRGEGARGATDAEQAFLQLMLAYDGPIGHIGEQYDGLDTPRLIFLGLTDTLWRAMDQTFSGIADDYDAWVLTSGNVAEIEETTDPDMVEIWADPDLEDVDSVFVPASEEVYNSAIIYDPDGELVERVHKPFLTQTEEEELALSYGPLESLRPVEVGPERFGVFTSKDAWMPPVNDRLGLLGSTVQVQPEAFSGWTITQLDDQEEWLPDVLTQSGWAAVQKYPSYRYGAMPVLTGNFVGMSFDGQAVVWGQAHPGVEFGGFVGQQERPGFLEVGPWAFDDPIEDDPELSLEQRREELREFGEGLLPGAGEPHENAYIDSVVARDLLPELVYQEGDDDRSDRIEVIDVTNPNDELDMPDGPIQRVRLTSDDGRIALTWQEESEGRLQERNSIWQWNGDEENYDFLTSSILTAGSVEPIHKVAPSIAISGDRRISIFQLLSSDEDPSSDLRAVRSEPGWEGVDFLELPLPDDSRDTWLPDIAIDGDRWAIVYTDQATGHDRVHLLLSHDDAETFEDPIAVDSPPDVTPPNTRGHQWHPTVDVKSDTIVAAWTDFRDFQWDLYGTFSLDGGDTWAQVRRIDDAGDGYERLHTDPRVVLVDDEEALISWTYQAERRPETDARYLRWDLSDDSLEDSVALDRDAETYPTHSWLPRIKPAGDGEDLAAVWMELRGETSVIVADIPGIDEPITVSHPGRVAWWPDLSVDEDRVVITWVEHLPSEGFRVKMATFDVA